VMCSRRDAAPRAILEYMAADVPVLVNSELCAGSRYVGDAGGLVCSPDQFPAGIAELLNHRSRYSPRAYYLAHYSVEQVVDRFVRMLNRAGFSLIPSDNRTAASPHMEDAATP